jgi:hypothetical protein
MAKTIVNKHFDDVNKIIREQFHEKEEYAKGEILIVNGDEPSLWVLDKNNTPKQISGGNTGGGDVVIDDEILNEIKEEIISGYTAADNTIIAAYKEADANIVSGFTANLSALTQTVNAIDAAYKAKDTEITNAITELETEILAHTVNGIAISENPVLDAEMLSIGGYSGMVLPEGTTENVTSLDTIQTAVKKVENMVIANSLAFAAGLNDVNRKVSDVDLTELVNTISTLQTEVNNLKSENIELKNRIASLEEWINSQSEGSEE